MLKMVTILILLVVQRFILDIKKVWTFSAEIKQSLHTGEEFPDSLIIK